MKMKEPQNFTRRRGEWAAMEMDYQMTLNEAVQIIWDFKLTAPEIRTAPEPLPVAKLTAYDADLIWRMENA